MCGIVGGFISSVDANAGLDAISHRGPDARGVHKDRDARLGHVRLSIIDTSEASNQPFISGPVTLAFNGEIWNYKSVRSELKKLGRTFKTNGDTEVFAQAIAAWRDRALDEIDGMFAAAWIDGDDLYLARDRFGEVPLHVVLSPDVMFASEVKALMAMGAKKGGEVLRVGPGEVWKIPFHGHAVEKRRYYDPPAVVNDRFSSRTRQVAAAVLRQNLQDSCAERAMSDVPVCTLLSGGIDSSAVAHFLSRSVPGLVAYTAVHNPRSRDLRDARIAAEWSGIELREVVVPVPTPDDLEEVIRIIEMPHKAQVEIGWPCLLLARRMKADGFKVTFSGEGSDELWASYGFAHHALAAGADFGEYRKDLFLTQERKNFARCNKIFMSQGIECRLPFLNRKLVEHALSLSREVVAEGKSRPKAVLQEAMRGLLPAEIVDRPKVAFQDGMGLKAKYETAVADPKRFYTGTCTRMYGKGVAS